MGIFGFNQIVKNGLYGSECVVAAESEKKSKFSDQLKLLQKNAEAVDEKSLEGGELGGIKIMEIYLGTQIYSRILEDLILKKISFF